MASSVRARSVVLAVACLGHVGLILLLSNGSNVTLRRAAREEQEPLLLLLLDDLLKPEPPPAPLVETRDVPGPSTDVEPLREASLAPGLSGSALPPAVSESVPPIDWPGEAERSAVTAIERQLAQDALLERSRQAFAGHPKGMHLPPPERRDHPLGDTEHFEGGETITWINKRCYYTTAQPVLPNYFNMMMPACKSRGSLKKR